MSDSAKPDPLADAAARIIRHVNADHVDALILLARRFANIEAHGAMMTSVDRLGFHVRLETQDGVHDARIAFSREVRSAAEAETVMIEMVRKAREQ